MNKEHINKIAETALVSEDDLRKAVKAYIRLNKLTNFGFATHCGVQVTRLKPWLVKNSELRGDTIKKIAKSLLV